MANEILKDEILSDEQLDNVAGGSYAQTFNDMDRFSRETGFHFHGSDSDKREQLRDILRECGIKIKDHGGFTANEYYLLNERGEKIRSLDETTAMNTAIHNYNHRIFIR